MKLFASICHDARLLPHFLAHYHAAGVTDFYISATPDVQKYAGNYSITYFQHPGVVDAITGGVFGVSAMRLRFQHPNEWVIIVDLDEFVEFPGEISELVKVAEGENANVIRATMWDRFTADGSLGTVDESTDLAQTFPVRAPFIKNVMRGTDFKAVIVRGLLKSCDGGGHHGFEGERVCSRELVLSHYKWIDGAVERLRHASETVAAAGKTWSIEYERALTHYETHGRFVSEEFDGEYVGWVLPRSPQPATDSDIRRIAEALAWRDRRIRVLSDRLREAASHTG
jgi:hypothetical protein